MKRWVNFRELKQRLDFLAVLQSYKVTMKAKGKQAAGPCPLPTHPKADAKGKSASFSVNLERGIWQCFSCKATGNVIEFAARMEGLNPDDPVDFRNAALLLQERFAVDAWVKSNGKPVPASPSKPKSEPVKQSPKSADSAKPSETVKINAPLDFALKGLDSKHRYLADRGLTEPVIEHFGLGYCDRGLMKGRIAIPLHDQAGKLIGYAGRLLDDQEVSEENPKYRFPGERQKGGVSYEFRKSHFLYHGHTIKKPQASLVVVEGFASVWWLWKAGYQNVVALMGSACSSEQAALIVKLTKSDGHVWILPDGDDAGDECALATAQELVADRFVRWVKLPDTRQPTDFQPDELAELIGPPD